MIFMASFELSHKTALLDPLLKNSSPIAPLPENKSNTVESSISFCIILNSYSFTLSNVGLVAIPSNVYNFVPLAFPLIILIFIMLPFIHILLFYPFFV